jgi:hypothetical protein
MSVQLPRSLSQFHSAMQESKEDMAETIREWIQTSNRHAELETLTRMSRKDLCDLMHAVLNAKTKTDNLK